MLEGLLCISSKWSLELESEDPAIIVFRLLGASTEEGCIGFPAQDLELRT